MRSRSFARLLFVAVMFACVAELHGQTHSNSTTGERVYAAAADSVFLIEVLNSAGAPVATASGFLVAANEILTNAHVADTGTIQLVSGSFRVPCAVERADHVNDLALCRLSISTNASPLRIAAADVKNGATVFALGNPRGLEKTITKGLFTGYRELQGHAVAQISAAISPGSSGGPILNTDGELVGVAVTSLVDGQTLNFAVPLAAIRTFLNSSTPQRADTSYLIETAKQLVAERKEATYGQPAWNDIDARLAATLTKAIDTAVDPDALKTVYSIAAIGHLDLQVQAARKRIRLSKHATREMYVALAQSLYWSAQLQQGSPNLDEAEVAARRAVLLGQPSNSGDLVLLADIQTAQQKYDAARLNYTKAAATATSPSERATAYMGLFYHSVAAKKLNEAESWFKKADDNESRSAFERSQYAQALSELGKHVEAGNQYLRAFQDWPSSYSFICNAGIQFWVGAKYDDALTDARKCLELGSTIKGAESDMADAHRAISGILDDRGVYDEAANHAREAIAIEADSGWAYFDLARALNGQRRFSEAIAAAKTAIRLTDGKYPAMHFELGSAYFELKQWPEAVEAYKKAAELGPTDANSAYNVAAALFNSHYYDDAVIWYRETLKRNPNHPQRTEILRTIEKLSGK